MLPEKAPDQVVCATAIANDAILIAIDGDMRRMTKRYGAASTPRFENLNLIHLMLPEPHAKSRMEQAMELIELEWAFTVAKAARRLWVEIAQHHIRTYR